MNRLQRTQRHLIFLSGLLPMVILLGFFCLAPLAWIFVSSIKSGEGWGFFRFQELLNSGFYRQAFWNSTWISSISSLVGLAVSLQGAASLRKVPGRLRDTVVSFINMTGNLSGVPLAFAYIILIGTNGALTVLLRHFGLSAGFELYSINGLILLYTYFQIPLGVLLLYPAFDALDDEWPNAAALLGAKPWQYWWHVGLPVLMPAVAGTFILLFANAMGAYASAFALTQGNFNLITIRIASLVAGDIFLEPEMAAALAVLLTLLLCIVTLVQQTLLNRRHHAR